MWTSDETDWCVVVVARIFSLAAWPWKKRRGTMLMISVLISMLALVTANNTSARPSVSVMTATCVRNWVQVPSCARAWWLRLCWTRKDDDDHQRTTRIGLCPFLSWALYKWRSHVLTGGQAYNHSDLPLLLVGLVRLSWRVRCADLRAVLDSRSLHPRVRRCLPVAEQLLVGSE